MTYAATSGHARERPGRYGKQPGDRLVDRDTADTADTAPPRKGPA